MSEEIVVESFEPIIESSEPLESKYNKNKYSSDAARHDAILKAKRDYYYRNNDLFKLKSRLRYYKNRLQTVNLSPALQEKYQTKIGELQGAIKDFQHIEKSEEPETSEEK